MEQLEGALPIVALYADLNKVRGSYYTRMLYPGLYTAKERFYFSFVEAYNLKYFSNGGTLFLAYPDKWRLFYTHTDGSIVHIWSGEQRPQFTDVEGLLHETRMRDA